MTAATLLASFATITGGATAAGFLAAGDNVFARVCIQGREQLSP